MALEYTVKVTQLDGKPVVLNYLDGNEALQMVMTLMTADHICEMHILMRHDATAPAIREHIRLERQRVPRGSSHPVSGGDGA